ncbi:CRISPR-associated endonuclease Cas2 [Oscillochloris sp. ZM17-4]|uniref:CRISPR-associated endonuclease Cas2 n=1 Tax=Oscillochloris sp. ZM17-4 TaxID=2866714 RepID=UPI001C72F99E|nr:CRISPR-associated endonuclease Cas2 [Oscillochloris sp. ZM17-4]MBX0326726.1 CRISPR-associated endonuclease Cas2 [Oscillochloris sp. ZM17-4]
MPPASEDTTLYIVAYDIPDDKRRTKVHRALCGYGAWTQYSLFECWLTKRQLLELRAKLARHLIAERDSVRFYPLCGSCQGKVITVGGARPHDPVTVIL